MPYLDVSDVLFDPELGAEPIQVIRRRTVTNSFGETQIVTSTFKTIAQVGPTTRNSLIREAAYTSNLKTIRVITVFKLTGSSKDQAQNTYEPDLIVWKNNTFICGEVEDYSQYGAGFVSADCEAFDWTVQETTGPTAAIIPFRELVGKSYNIPIVAGS